MNPYIITHLTAEENIELEPYKDSLGFWTLGVGHLIDRRKGGEFPKWIGSVPISLEEGEQLLKDDVSEIESAVFERFPWFSELSAVRQCVFISMAFQMGVEGLAGFRKALNYASNGLFEASAAEMLESDWRRQTPSRSGRLAQAMRTDSAQFLEGA